MFTLINIKHAHDTFGPCPGRGCPALPEYDVYIGRGRCPRTGEPSVFGNPFTHKPLDSTLAKFQVASRAEALEAYRKWAPQQPEIMNRLHDLKGKRVACWCKPKPCHGDILRELLESQNNEPLFDLLR